MNPRVPAKNLDSLGALDCLEADEAMIEEIAEAPDYTIDVDAAKQDIRMGKLSMSKVRVRMQVIWRDAEHQN